SGMWCSIRMFRRLSSRVFLYVFQIVSSSASPSICGLTTAGAAIGTGTGAAAGALPLRTAVRPACVLGTARNRVGAAGWVDGFVREERTATDFDMGGLQGGAGRD